MQEQLQQLHDWVERLFALGIVNWQTTLAWYVCSVIVFAVLQVYEEEEFRGDGRDAEKARKSRDRSLPQEEQLHEGLDRNVSSH